MLLAAALLTSQLMALVPATLHVKAGPDGICNGDCPFAHALRLVMEHKGVDYSLAPHGPEGKPEWLLQEYGGNMPLLELPTPGGETSRHIESSEIALVLEAAFPEPSIVGTEPSVVEAAEAARAPVFGCFARYCKNTEADRDDELKKSLLLALCNLDAHLAQAATPYAAGAELSLTDCFLLPALYHMQVAGRAYKQFEVPPAFDALNAYMTGPLQSELFKRTAPDEALIRWGWANARGDTQAAARAASERASV